MSKIDKPKASVSTIWTNVIIDGEPAKVSIVRGMSKILFSSCGFTIPITGKHYDVPSVVRAYKEQQKLINKALENTPQGGEHVSWGSPEGAEIAADLDLPDDNNPPQRGLPQCFSPITEDELDSLIDGCTLVEDLGDNGKD